MSSRSAVARSINNRTSGPRPTPSASRAETVVEQPTDTAVRRGLVKPINLALQGGGAHGAFTWGVLDRLLEDGRTFFDGVSGTSAGAFNAVALAGGLMEGGAPGARAKLEGLWRAAADAAHFSPLRSHPLDPGAATGNRDWLPGRIAFDMMTRMISPYQFNPMDLNPLRHMLQDAIDFKGLKRRSPVQLFIAATDVATGKARIFETKEISVDVVLASACLPQVHQAVKIGRRHYWDGGFSANPSILPLITGCPTDDTLIVQLNPDDEPEVPTRVREIAARMLRLTFNLPFRREIETIERCRSQAREGFAFGGRQRQRIKRHRFHLVEAGPYVRELGETSRIHPDWELLSYLRDCGRHAAEAWLKKHHRSVGRASSVDLAAKFL